MARKAYIPPALHELESEVMLEMWRLEKATVREVMDAINARSDKARAYTTFMTILARLDSKGLLKREREGKTDVYELTLTRDEYERSRADAEVTALVEQFGDVAMVQFAKRLGDLDPKRLRELRRLARRD